MRSLCRAIAIVSAVALQAGAGLSAVAGDEPAERARLERRRAELDSRMRALREERARLEARIAERRGGSSVVADLPDALDASGVSLPRATAARDLAEAKRPFEVLFLVARDGPYRLSAGRLKLVDVPRDRFEERLGLLAGHEAARRRDPEDVFVLLAADASATFEAVGRALEHGARAGLRHIGLAALRGDGGLGFLPVDLAPGDGPPGDGAAIHLRPAPDEPYSALIGALDRCAAQGPCVVDLVVPAEGGR